MNAKLRTWVLPVALVSAFALSALAQERGGKAKKEESDGPPAVGKKAPAFKEKATSGTEIDLETTYKGKIVLVDFWATWCGPCVKEVPHVKEAYKKFHGKGFEVLGIAEEEWRPGGSVEKLKKFVEKQEMPWEQIYDSGGEIAKQYGVKCIPSPFLVDGDTGVILATSGDLRGSGLSKTIEKHLKKKDGKTGTSEEKKSDKKSKTDGGEKTSKGEKKDGDKSNGTKPDKGGDKPAKP